MITIDKYEEFGIYAYRDMTSNIIFYVGRQSQSKSKEKDNYLRAYDFYAKNRNEKCLNHIKTIGERNVEVLWLYKTNDEHEKLFSIELKFQAIYYDIYKDLFLCNEQLIEKFNPNHGNKWTEEKKKLLSEKKEITEKDH